jgi:hypothetical protein
MSIVKKITNSFIEEKLEIVHLIIHVHSPIDGLSESLLKISMRCDELGIYFEMEQIENIIGSRNLEKKDYEYRTDYKYFLNGQKSELCLTCEGLVKLLYVSTA